MLVVRCEGRNLEVFVRFRNYFGNKAAPVKARVGRQLVLSERWGVSPVGTEAFARESVSLARELARGAAFTVEATDFRGPAYRVAFDRRRRPRRSSF